jgi:hypothetical protein
MGRKTVSVTVSESVSVTVLVRFLSLILLLLQLSPFAPAHAASLPPSPSLSLEALDSAANLLMLGSDGALASCHLKPKRARKLLNRLHPLIDEKMTGWRLDDHRERLLESCSVDCHCGVYASALEKRVVADDLALLNALYDKAKGASRADLRKCALRTRKWFCRSRLRAELEKPLRSGH